MTQRFSTSPHDFVGMAGMWCEKYGGRRAGLFRLPGLPLVPLATCPATASSLPCHTVLSAANRQRPRSRPQARHPCTHHRAHHHDASSRRLPRRRRCRPLWRQRQGAAMAGRPAARPGASAPETRGRGRPGSPREMQPWPSLLQTQATAAFSWRSLRHRAVPRSRRLGSWSCSSSRWSGPAVACPTIACQHKRPASHN